MGNVVLSLHNFGSQVNKWSLEKKLLIWRTLAMSACLIGTAVYIRPLEPYLEVPFFGILVPTFITGYILVHSSDILLLMMRKEYIFLETCFASTGAIGNLACGVYQLQKWICWVIENVDDSEEQDYDVPELILALALLFHAIFLIAVLIHRIIQLRQSSNQNQLQDPHN